MLKQKENGRISPHLLLGMILVVLSLARCSLISQVVPYTNTEMGVSFELLPECTFPDETASGVEYTCGENANAHVSINVIEDHNEQDSIGYLLSVGQIQSLLEHPRIVEWHALELQHAEYQDATVTVIYEAIPDLRIRSRAYYTLLQHDNLAILIHIVGADAYATQLYESILDSFRFL